MHRRKYNEGAITGKMPILSASPPHENPLDADLQYFGCGTMLHPKCTPPVTKYGSIQYTSTQTCQAHQMTPTGAVREDEREKRRALCRRKLDPDRQMPFIPHLCIEECAKAMEWYKEAFGATEVRRIPAEDGKR